MAPSRSTCHLRACLFVISLLAAILADAQTYNFKNYSLDEGLSQSEINCMFEDSRGYLWIGTSGGGLNRFDGKEFKSYEQKDGLCGQIINSVTEDAQNNILIGTEFNEVCLYDGRSFHSVNPPASSQFSLGSVRFIETDDNGNIIVGKDNQLLLYNGSKYKVLNARNTKDSIHVQCDKRDSRNIIWIGTSDGLYVLKNKTLLRITDDEYLQHMNIVSLTEDVNGNIWATDILGALRKIRIIGPSHYQVRSQQVDSVKLPEHCLVSAIHFDQNNQLWIATHNRGLFKSSAKGLVRFDQSNGLPVENVKTILEDHSGNLWFGTSGGGLVKFSSQAFTYFDNVEGLSQPDIFAMSADQSGNIWIGTQLHGLYRYDGKESHNMTAASGIGEVEIRCIFTDSRNRVWIGTTNGITIFEKGRFMPYRDQRCVNIRAIYEDAAGNIWIGTRGKHAFMDNGKEVIQIADAQGLTNDNVYSFTQHKNSDVWIGTGNGIYIYSDGRIRKHLTEGLCNAYAGSMVKDKFGHIWVGTDNCVALFDGSVFRSFGANNGLTSGTVYLLNSGSTENIWVGTNKGLDKITLQENGEVASIRNYGKAEGFRGIECNSRATCVDQNGCLWFGTIKGAIKFDPREELLRKHEKPIVHLTGLKLFYEHRDLSGSCGSLSHWYCIPQNLTLPYNQNHITFEFAAISKNFPDDIKYSFMLEGFDNAWTPPALATSATYSNLPDGNYTFRLLATNKDGITAEAQPLMFSIRPPFWTTWWFIGLCVIAMIAFIYLYNEYRKRKHVLYLERLEKIIRQRTAEVIKQRDENEILLKEVHHRVKNNLQIINSLINIQSEYFNDERSSELFREIRNRIRTISLVHEKLYKSDDYGNINVKEYINMLVENLIDTYNINKDIQLRLDLEIQHFNLNTIIPLGLLLNEIISNSFKYAFNDVDAGIIEITLHKSTLDEEYTLIIGDNGKGFEDAVFSAENPTLGLELVKILASQLNGSIEKIRKQGTHYILKFRPLKN